MFHTLDLTRFTCFKKDGIQLIDDSTLYVRCTTSEVLVLASTLASLDIACEIILIDVMRFKLVYMSPWVAE